MTGAMLLGACEGHAGDSPAALLAHFNRVLSQSQVGDSPLACVHALIQMEQSPWQTRATLRPTSTEEKSNWKTGSRWG